MMWRHSSLSMIIWQTNAKNFHKGYAMALMSVASVRTLSTRSQLSGTVSSATKLSTWVASRDGFRNWTMLMKTKKRKRKYQLRRLKSNRLTLLRRVKAIEWNWTLGRTTNGLARIAISTTLINFPSISVSVVFKMNLAIHHTNYLIHVVMHVPRSEMKNALTPDAMYFAIQVLVHHVRPL